MDEQVIQKGKELLQKEEIGVAYVIDGDTIVLTNGDKVRYIGIDTPELNEVGADDDECLAWTARLRNMELLSNGDFELVKDPNMDKDKYGRLLRYVYSGGVFVNEKLVKEGLAETFFCEPYWENCPVVKDNVRRQQILLANVKAKNNKRGIYSGVCEEKNKEEIAKIESEISSEKTEIKPEIVSKKEEPKPQFHFVFTNTPSPEPKQDKQEEKVPVSNQNQAPLNILSDDNNTASSSSATTTEELIGGTGNQNSTSTASTTSEIVENIENNSSTSTASTTEDVFLIDPLFCDPTSEKYVKEYASKLNLKLVNFNPRHTTATSGRINPQFNKELLLRSRVGDSEWSEVAAYSVTGFYQVYLDFEWEEGENYNQIELVDHCGEKTEFNFDTFVDLYHPAVVLDDPILNKDENSISLSWTGGDEALYSSGIR